MGGPVSFTTEYIRPLSASTGYEDLEQIDDMTLEEIDLIVASGHDLNENEIFLQEDWRGMQGFLRTRGGAEEWTNREDSKALVTVDGEGVDWTNHSEDEDYALRAICNSPGLRYRGKFLFKLCVKVSYANLKKCRFVTAEGMHAVTPPMTGNYMPSGPDVEVDDSKFTYGPKQTHPNESETQSSEIDTYESNISAEPSELVSEPVVNEELHNKMVLLDEKNRFLIEAARTMLADSFLPNTFWAKAVSTALLYDKRRGSKRGRTSFMMNLKELIQARKRYALMRKAAKLSGEFEIQKVWVLVDLPYGKKAIGTKWVYQNKKDERGVVVRNKARLVAQGHRQEEGIDYDEFKSMWMISLWVTRKILVGVWCDEFEALMKSRFQMSSMGELTFFLGLQVKQKPDGIFISQDKYVAEILKKFDFANVKTASTPIETQKPLVKDEEANDVDVHLYRSMIGSLMYLTASRPDIMFAVCACSRFQVTPKTSHLSAVKRIFRYLKGKPKLGLWYPRVSSFDLESYSDSDYAGANLDRKSTTGGCQFLGRRLISWQCKKQTIVATSTTEAEYVAAASCCGQVLWIQNQMLDYGFNFMNTKIYIDNESTICIVKNPVLKIHTDDNVADLLTKAFDVSRLESSPAQTSEKTSGENLGGHSSSDRSLSGNEGDMTLQSVYDLCLSLCAQEGVISTDKEKVSTDRPIVSTDGSKVSTDRQIEGTEEQIESTDGQRKGTEDHTEEGSATQATQTPTSTIFGDDETIAKVLLNMSQAKAVSREKEKGVELKDIEETDRPRPTSTRSLLTLKPLPKIDPKDKGKKKIEEEDESESESDGIPEAEKKFKQLESDEEMARKIQEEWEGEEERNRIAEEKATNEALMRNFDDIKARIEADRLLAEKLQEQEREQFTIEERAKFLHDTIAAQRKFLAQQRSEAIRNRPPTKNQLRNQMMTYLKHVGNFKHSELKTKKFEEIQALYEKIKRSDEDFISIGSAEDERQIKRMNEKGIDSSKSEVIKEESKEEVQEESKEEESTRKRKLGTRKKMKSRKRRFIQNTSEDDSEKENDELRLHLTIAPDEEKEVDYEILDRKYPIKDWKTECLGTKPQADKAEHLEEINQNVVIRSNGQKRYFSTLMRVLSIFDREDLNAVYQLVMDRYQDEIPEGFDRVLWGDLMVMFNPDDENEFWNSQQDWDIVCWKLHEKKYPLRKEVLMQMLKLKLESEEDSTMALELIRFIKKLLAEHKNWLVHKQTACGKDFSNPFMVDNLPKIVGFSTHLASVVKSWLVHDQTVHALASPKANELTIPEQTATGKGTSNPLMAGSLPKTTKPT
ncbi:putative ribonuclease H-like domain-containing protein [Tanacetum coccineum]